MDRIAIASSGEFNAGYETEEDLGIPGIAQSTAPAYNKATYEVRPGHWPQCDGCHAAMSDGLALHGMQSAVPVTLDLYSHC